MISLSLDADAHHDTHQTLGSWEIPEHMASLERMSVRRKDPRDSDGAAGGSPPLSMLEACDVDMSVRLYCKRAMMQVSYNYNSVYI